MKCDVTIRTRATIELKPGDECILHSDVLNTPRKCKIHRIIEDRNGVKFIFRDGTWRPIRTYGITWEKAN